MRDRMNRLIFEKYEDADGEWRWRLKAANGKILGASCQGFTRTHCNEIVKRLAQAFDHRKVGMVVKTVERSESTIGNHQLGFDLRKDQPRPGGGVKDGPSSPKPKVRVHGQSRQPPAAPGMTNAK